MVQEELERLGWSKAELKRRRKGDEAKVMSLMHSHLDSVASRALVAPAPQRGRDLLDILAPYAEESEGTGRVVKMPKVVRARSMWLAWKVRLIPSLARSHGCFRVTS